MNRGVISELILIIAGFIIAETLVRRYLEITTGVVPWFILPLIAISLIPLAIKIKNGEEIKIFSELIWLLYILLILWVGLFVRGSINGKVYVWLTLGTLIIYFLIQIIGLRTLSKLMQNNTWRKNRK